MASIFSHAVAAAALAPVLLPRPIPRRVVLLGALAAILPDADVVGFRFGIAYGDLLGHRGLTHSLAFAALLAAVLLLIARPAPHSRVRVFAYLALAAASHGVLDAFTNGGLGVAFLAPFSTDRFFFPVRPIQVSPISASAFFSDWGRRVIASEVLWIWLPALFIASVAWTHGRVGRRGAGIVALLLSTQSCASHPLRGAWYPIPEQAPSTTPPELRGLDASAAAIPGGDRLEIYREIVRAFYRPRRGQARWIDLRPLAHRRSRGSDSLVTSRPRWAAAIVDAVSLRRVCALDESDEECRGRLGGVLRFSMPYAADPDTAVVFAQYAQVGRGEVPVAGPGYEMEFRLARRDGRWRIVSRRTVAGPDAP